MTSLRHVSLPRFALRREEAAASLSISPTLFDTWVNDGLMPRGHKVRGVILWDVNEVFECWRKLRDGDKVDHNPFDHITA